MHQAAVLWQKYALVHAVRDAFLGDPRPQDLTLVRLGPV